MRIVTGFAGAILAAACVATDAAPTALRFSAPEGRGLNEFYRQGAGGGGLARSPGRGSASPRGSPGAAVWLRSPAGGLTWESDVTLTAAHRDLPDGGVLHGV